MSLPDLGAIYAAEDFAWNMPIALDAYGEIILRARFRYEIRRYRAGLGPLPRVAQMIAWANSRGCRLGKNVLEEWQEPSSSFWTGMMR